VPEQYRPMAFSIETLRLSMRLRDPDDAEWNLELLAEGGTTRTLAEARQRLADQHAQAYESGLNFLAIRRRRERDPIGYCGLLVGRASFDEPEIAYELLQRHKDTGTPRRRRARYSRRPSQQGGGVSGRLFVPGMAPRSAYLTSSGSAATTASSTSGASSCTWSGTPRSNAALNSASSIVLRLQTRSAIDLQAPHCGNCLLTTGMLARCGILDLRQKCQSARTASSSLAQHSSSSSCLNIVIS
jgi:hypothetical protein